MSIRVVAVAAAVLVTGCGSSEAAKTATTKPAAAPQRTAYEPAMRDRVANDVRRQVAEVHAGGARIREQPTVRCAADTARTFTCYSTVRLRFPKDDLCAELNAEQRGTVNPSGTFDWQTVKTDNPDPESC